MDRPWPDKGVEKRRKEKVAVCGPRCRGDEGGGGEKGTGYITTSPETLGSVLDYM